MGHFLSVDQTHLENAARYARSKDVVDVMERRPDLDPKAILRRPTETTMQESLITEWIHYLTPSNDGLTGITASPLTGLKNSNRRRPGIKETVHPSDLLDASHIAIDIPVDGDELKKTSPKGGVAVTAPAGEERPIQRMRHNTLTTTVFMSPMAWALDHLDTQMVQMFLEQSLSNIHAPICMVTKQNRLNDATIDEWRYLGKKTYSMSMLEYLISMKLCPHLFHNKDQRHEIFGRVADILDMICSSDTFDLNFLSKLKSFSQSKPILSKQNEQLEPIVHLAIRYMATYFTMNSHYQSDAAEESRGKLWCRRHKHIMNIKSKDWTEIRSVQYEKQKVILEQLLQHPDLDLTMHVNSQKQTALHYAVMYDCMDALNMIINSVPKDKAQKLMEQPDADGMTPLYMALKKGYHPIAQQLIRHGADYFAECKQEKMKPIDLVFSAMESGGFTSAQQGLMQLIDAMESDKLHAMQ